MKFNVIIVDDEFFIRQRIKKIMPWEELGLTFVGEAENGAEAIDLLQNNSVDIIILDIKMPEMTGIEVAEYVYEHYPSTKVIILSGYNDFEYARSALKYGVADYLLKPVDKDSLKTTLENCIVKMKKSKTQLEQIQKYYHYEKCSNLSNLLSGHIDLDDLLSLYPEMKKTPHSLYVGAFIFEEGDIIINELTTALRSHGFDCEYFKELDYTYTLQLFLEDKESLQGVTALMNKFLLESEVYIFLSLSHLFSLDENWLPFYKQTHYSLNQRYFNLSSNLYIGSEETSAEKYTTDLCKIRSNILALLNSQNNEEFKQYVHQIFADIGDKHNIEYLQLIVTEFFITYNIYYHELVEFKHNITEFTSMLIDEEYQLDELENTVIFYGLKCMSKNETAPSNFVLSDKIMDYINTHYSDPELTVASLANLFDLNPSYMGSVFKKVKNQSILQYITSVRMEASKTLLETNEYKVSDAATAVGYTDAFYYSKRFKKMYGYSPKEFSLLVQERKSKI